MQGSLSCAFIMEQSSLDMLGRTESSEHGEEVPKKSKGKKKVKEETVEDAWRLEDYLADHKDLHWKDLRLDTKQEQGQACCLCPYPCCMP